MSTVANNVCTQKYSKEDCVQSEFRPRPSNPPPTIFLRKVKKLSGCNTKSTKSQDQVEWQLQTTSNRPPIVKDGQARDEAIVSNAMKEIYKPHRRYIMTLLLVDELHPIPQEKSQSKAYADFERLLLEG